MSYLTHRWRVPFMTIITVLGVMTHGWASLITLDQALADPAQNTQRNQELLLKVPQDKATVGVLLVYHSEGVPYVLLGRERIDSDDPKKAGTFCDLGGRVKLDGTTFLDNMQRELIEESAQSLDIDPQDFLQHAYVIYKNNKGREILYAIYVIDEAQYKSADLLNTHRAQTTDLPADYLEKDMFLWLEGPALAQVKAGGALNIVPIQDVDGQQYQLKFREYFVGDCLRNPDFAKVINTLVTAPLKKAA